MAARTFLSAARPGPTQRGSAGPGLSAAQTRTGQYWFNPAAFICAVIDTALRPLAQRVLRRGPLRQSRTQRHLWPRPDQLGHGPHPPFPFKERWKLDFRADFFNIMNHGNWNNPTTQHHQQHVRPSHVVRHARAYPDGAEAVLLRTELAVSRYWAGGAVRVSPASFLEVLRDTKKLVA